MACVLIIDDEESIRVTLREFLRAEGHTTFTAAHADEALPILRQEPIDVTVTDIILPRVSGVHLLRMIREISPETLVIMMTGEPTVATATESLRHGAFEYLVKPVTKAAIVHTVGNAARLKKLNDDKRHLEIINQEYRDNLELLVEHRTRELSRLNNQLLAEVKARTCAEAHLTDALQQLSYTFDGIVNALAATSEWRDPYTAGHQRRVAQLAVAITRQLGGSADDLVQMRMAGLLHDIGKIAIPNEILSKPRKLTATEFELIKPHPQVGYEILHSIDFPWPVAQVVRQHHVRLDGSGYPADVAPEEMLYEARILAVADVVEAMSTHRPYRPALGLEAAMAEIRAGAGSRYDEDVVDACLAVCAAEAFQFM